MSKSRFGWAFVCGVIVSLIVFWIYDQFQQARDLGLAALCSSGLKEANTLFVDYRERHNGKFPLRLEDLDLSKATPDALRCPKARQEGTRAYLYVPIREDASDDTPILICWRHPHLQMLIKGGWVKRLPKDQK